MTVANNLLTILDLDESAHPPIDMFRIAGPTKNIADSLDDDLNFARNNIYELIQQGVESCKQLTQIAKASELPSSFEVLSGFMETLVGMNGDLIELHKKKNDLNKQVLPATKNGITVEKAVFVGSTAELAQLVKEQEKNASDIPQ